MLVNREPPACPLGDRLRGPSGGLSLLWGKAAGRPYFTTRDSGTPLAGGVTRPASGASLGEASGPRARRRAGNAGKDASMSERRDDNKSSVAPRNE